MINFDQASSSFPKAPPVPEAVYRYLKEGAFNLGRGDYQAASSIAETVYNCRLQLARLVGLEDPRQVILNAGITYSLNQIVLALIEPGDTVLCSSMEHNSVLRPLNQQKAAQTVIIEADSEGFIPAESLEAKLLELEEKGQKPKAAFFTAASNVSGTIQDLASMGKILKKYGVYFIVDSAQALGSCDLDITKLQAQAICFTAHKGLLGPQGLGGVFLDKEFASILKPVIAGGTGSFSQSLQMPDNLPDRFEAGTLNLPAIAGLNAALSWLLEADKLEQIQAHKNELKNEFIAGIEELNCPEFEILGPSDRSRQVGVVSLTTGEIDPSALANFLAEREVLTRVGLHCAPLAHKSLGSFPQGTIRFSFGYANSKSEITKVCEYIREYLEVHDAI
ncbi:MAG: aminotransferase class V-fold PLP-dependent enzyme [Eubacteriales bacterium]|nr:aminotransferase class V-fold PLP-dependent enzyme [Eubacteriales bacterium]